MKRSMTLVGTGLALLLGMSQAGAAPSAVGIYGGRSAADGTYVLFETTRRGFIKNLEIAGLTALIKVHSSVDAARGALLVG